MKRELIILPLLLVCGATWASTLPVPAGYPTLLGVSCGGVHVSSYVTGFDQAGNITGELYAWTACGGSGRGGGYKTRHYQSWSSITWALDGSYVVRPYDNLVPDPSFAATDQYSNYIFDVCNGMSYLQASCLASAYISYVPAGQPPIAPLAPSVVGLMESAAASAIKAAGLIAAPYYAVTASVSPGHVFFQTPAAGTQLSAGAVVHFGVARAAPIDED